MVVNTIIGCSGKAKAPPIDGALQNLQLRVLVDGCFADADSVDGAFTALAGEE